MNAHIVPLPHVPPEFLAAYDEFLEHYAECAGCERERDRKGRLRLCRVGLHLGYQALDKLPPGQGQLLVGLLQMEPPDVGARGRGG